MDSGYSGPEAEQWSKLLYLPFPMIPEKDVSSNIRSWIQLGNYEASVDEQIAKVNQIVIRKCPLPGCDHTFIDEWSHRWQWHSELFEIIKPNRERDDVTANRVELETIQVAEAIVKPQDNADKVPKQRRDAELGPTFVCSPRVSLKDNVDMSKMVDDENTHTEEHVQFPSNNNEEICETIGNMQLDSNQPSGKTLYGSTDRDGIDDLMKSGYTTHVTPEIEHNPQGSESITNRRYGTEAVEVHSSSNHINKQAETTESIHSIESNQKDINEERDFRHQHNPDPDVANNAIENVLESGTAHVIHPVPKLQTDGNEAEMIETHIAPIPVREHSQTARGMIQRSMMI